MKLKSGLKIVENDGVLEPEPDEISPDESGPDDVGPEDIPPDEEAAPSTESPGKSRIPPTLFSSVIAKLLGFELRVPLASAAGRMSILTLSPGLRPVKVK